MIREMLKIYFAHDQSCHMTKLLFEQIQNLKLQCTRMNFFDEK